MYCELGFTYIVCLLMSDDYKVDYNYSHEHTPRHWVTCGRKNVQINSRPDHSDHDDKYVHSLTVLMNSMGTGFCSWSIRCCSTTANTSCVYVIVAEECGNTVHQLYIKMTFQNKHCYHNKLQCLLSMVYITMHCMQYRMFVLL